jgi:hypothetical protein
MYTIRILLNWISGLLASGVFIAGVVTGYVECGWLGGIGGGTIGFFGAMLMMTACQYLGLLRVPTPQNTVGPSASGQD